MPFNFNENFLVKQENLFYLYYLNKKYDSCSILIKRLWKDKLKLNKDNLHQLFTLKAYLLKATNQLDSASYYLLNSLSYYEKDNTIYI